MAKLPDSIRKFFESTNDGDTATLLGCFTAHATLNDCGRRFEGQAGVASWDSTDNIGVQSHIDVLNAITSQDSYVVTVRVSGNGFNGTGRMHFLLDDDKIAKLDIT